MCQDTITKICIISKLSSKCFLMFAVRRHVINNNSNDHFFCMHWIHLNWGYNELSVMTFHLRRNLLSPDLSRRRLYSNINSWLGTNSQRTYSIGKSGFIDALNSVCVYTCTSYGTAFSSTNTHLVSKFQIQLYLQYFHQFFVWSILPL